MPFKLSTVAILALTVAGAPALAAETVEQTQAGPQETAPHPTGPLPATATPQQVAALAGQDVYSSDGQWVGEVSDILANSAEEPQAVLVNGDGLLAIDGGQMQIPYEALTLAGGRLVVAMTYAQAAALMGKSWPF